MTGRFAPSPTGELHLGNLALYGERGLLRISPSDILRLRWNPFHEYLERRTLEFLGLAEPEERFPDGRPAQPEPTGSPPTN